MANKLKWFTHDNDARHDDFIHRAEDKFGPFGYSAYFKLIEVLHQHGTGDRLEMTTSRLASELRCTWPKLQVYLDYTQTMGKVKFNHSSGVVELQINKFLQRQKKLRASGSSTVPQQFPNRPLERQGEGQRHTDSVSVPPKPKDHGLGMPYSGVVLQFWSAYPPSRRSDKRECQYEWDQANIDKPEVVLAGLERLKESDDWKKEAGRWIPSSTKFLRRRMWEKTEGENGRKLNPNQFA